ncbi:hypothetical protein K5M76_09495 [Shewanella xiamenensis]|uniref:hypothetical protein n=1 Tax=Shewanella xiamenensis TaxID=332186 RepID=UPI00217EE8B6|nr:hypothetical protein [Shewanella xiamenensis]MCT8857558.1 hypothetical protein [Shewanella xiamenensis]UWG66423.1 hypothetical protein K5M76_09495 [Shewanella xiamenensis]
MDKNIVIIGACGVGKSMLSRALMTLQLRNAVVTVADISDVKPEHGEITGAWLDELMPPKLEDEESSHFSPRRNKSDRKRNRANRWR